MQIVNKEAQLREHEGFLLAVKCHLLSCRTAEQLWKKVFCKMIAVYTDENWKPLAAAF